MLMRPLAALAFSSGLAALCLSTGPPAQAPDDKAQLLAEKTYHIGNSPKPEWKEFTSVEPDHPTRLKIDFDVGRAIDKLTLEVRSGGVGDVWKVRVNGKEVGELKKGEAAQTRYFVVPPEAVRKTENELVIECANKVEDDVFIGPVTLHHRPHKELLKLAEVTVRVADAATGKGVPARITVTRLKQPAKKDEKEEERAELEVEESKLRAVRRGIIYAIDGAGRFSVPAGRYRVYATRGFEYSVAQATISLAPAEERAVDLAIEREVDTAGFLAADTHIHTKTYSKHGDASVEERLATIAGEGVEVAIATDHNHHTDYRPKAKELGVQDEFVSVVGNEFTTVIGHFNAFPIDRDAKPARHSSKDWEKLLKSIRATPGVQVVIANHPRRGKPDEHCFNNIDLNPASGEAHRGPSWLGVDAIEVLNGKGLQDDEMVTFRDWFALLNRGLRVAAVAGSDSHTVEGIVGQARTYLRSRTDDPRELRPREIASSFLQGRLLVSLGLLARVKVNGRWEVGDLATGVGGTVSAEIAVTGPRWTRADEVELYLNGLLVRSEKVKHADDAVVKFHATWEVPRPPNDAHLVVIATGPPVTAPYWALAQEKKYLLGATNPVWLDCDGDGRFSSAHEYALKVAADCGADLRRVHATLARYDGAVAVQTASLFRRRIQAELQMEYEKLIDGAAKRLDGLLASKDKALNAHFTSYIKAAPVLDVYTRSEQIERELMLKKEAEDEEKARKEEAKKAREEREKRRKEREKAAKEKEKEGRKGKRF